MTQPDSPFPPLTLEIGADGGILSGGQPLTGADLAWLIPTLQHNREMTIVGARRPWRRKRSAASVAAVRSPPNKAEE